MEQLFTFEKLLKLSLLSLTVVGIVLFSEGEHLAQMQLFGEAVSSMSTSSFIVVITVLAVTGLADTDLAQTHLVQQPWPRILPPINLS